MQPADLTISNEITQSSPEELNQCLAGSDLLLKMAVKIWISSEMYSMTIICKTTLILYAFIYPALAFQHAICNTYSTSTLHMRDSTVNTNNSHNGVR